MKVFITGASGYIGSHVVPIFLENGHTVLALSRSEEQDNAILSRHSSGVEPVRANLEDAESLYAVASRPDVDAVVHLAFIHNFADMANSGKRDNAAVEAFGRALKGTNKPFMVTSGTGIAQQGVVCDEDTEPNLQGFGAARGVSENLTKALAKEGVRSMVIRFPPTVHSDKDKTGAFSSTLFATAHKYGFSGYVGDGSNVWPAVHVKDAAQLVYLGITNPNVPAGSILVAVQDEGVPFKQIAEGVAKRLNVPVKQVEADKAGEMWGFVGHLVPLNMPSKAEKTKQWTGWQPKEKTLLEDYEAGSYDRHAV